MFNKVILSGHLVRDPEISYTNSGKARGKFVLAVSRYNRDTDFFNCVCWEPVTKSLKYIKKGSLVLVEGSLQNFKRDDGSFSSQIVVSKITFFPKTVQPALVSDEEKSEPVPDISFGSDEEFEDIPF